MAADWDCPDAELVMAPEEMWGSRETWLAERRLGIGGSDVASLMGDGKYADSTQYDVWLDKTGRIPEKDPTLAMEMGNDFEDAVAMRFARATGLEIQPQGLLRSRISSVILNSPDRLTSDGGGLECKTSNEHAHRNLMRPGEIPPHWRWQMVSALAVTGRSHWYLAANFGLGGGAKWETRVLTRDECEEDIERLFDFIPQWWLDHVVADQPPTVGAPESYLLDEPGTRVEAVLPDDAWMQSKRLRAIRREMRELKAEADEIAAEFKAEVGGASILTAHTIPIIQIQHRKGRRTFKPELFKKEHPEIPLDPYYATGAPSRAVVLIGDEAGE